MVVLMVDGISGIAVPLEVLEPTDIPIFNSAEGTNLGIDMDADRKTNHVGVGNPYPNLVFNFEPSNLAIFYFEVFVESNTYPSEKADLHDRVLERVVPLVPAKVQMDQENHQNVEDVSYHPLT